MVSPAPANGFALAQQARERFVLHIGRTLPELVKVIDQRLTALLDQTGTMAEIQATEDPLVRQFIEGRPDETTVEIPAT